MSSTSFRSGVYSRPWARPVTRSRAGFFEPSLVGGPLGVPPPYDGIRAQATSERAQATSERAQANERGVVRGGVGWGGLGGVGVPPPYDGTFRSGVGGVGVPPPYDGTFRSGGGLRSRSIFKHDAGYIGYLSDDESLGEGADAADADSDVVGRRHREVIAQMHGREISFTHTVFAVVALLMFCVYFVAFIDRMRVNAFNATSMR